MDDELAEKEIAYQLLLERYNLKLANEYDKKSERMPVAHEVFNEVELVLDEHDKKLLAETNSDAIGKPSKNVNLYLKHCRVKK